MNADFEELYERFFMMYIYLYLLQAEILTLLKKSHRKRFSEL